MRVRYDEFRRILREELFREQHETVSLSDGVETQYGSPEHLKDMQAILAGLAALKSQHSYGSAARSKYAAAYQQLRTQLKRASRAGASEEEPRTFAQLENDDPQHDGRTGYGANGEGTFGRGQYRPGFENKSLGDER